MQQVREDLMGRMWHACAGGVQQYLQQGERVSVQRMARSTASGRHGCQDS